MYVFLTEDGCCFGWSHSFIVARVLFLLPWFICFLDGHGVNMACWAFFGHNLKSGIAFRIRESTLVSCLPSRQILENSRTLEAFAVLLVSLESHPFTRDPCATKWVCIRGMFLAFRARTRSSRGLGAPRLGLRPKLGLL